MRFDCDFCLICGYHQSSSRAIENLSAAQTFDRRSTDWESRNCAAFRDGVRRLLFASTVVVADDRYTETALEKLVALLRNANAAMADGLVIKCLAGNLSIEGPAVRRGAMLIRIPHDCLIPLKAFRFALAGDAIAVSSPHCTMEQVTVAITQAMFEIYNLSGKIAQHRRTSPWSLIASHPDLLSYITPPSRDDFPFSARDIKSGNEAKVTLASFLHSRLLSHKESERAKPTPVLVPIIDCLNHHWKGEPYSYDRDRAVVMRRSDALPGRGDECFASYGLHDAYDTWLTYGFVDEEVPFVRSVPTTLNIPATGAIGVGDAPDEVDRAAQDLQFYVPRILSRRGKRLRVGAVIIPGPQAPRSLRRALRAVIRELGAPPRRHSALVRGAEEQILDANLTYYSELKSCLESLPTDNDLHNAIRANFVRLCEGQLVRLKSYSSYAAG